MLRRCSLTQVLIEERRPKRKRARQMSTETTRRHVEGSERTVIAAAIALTSMLERRSIV